MCQKKEYWHSGWSKWPLPSTYATLLQNQICCCGWRVTEKLRDAEGGQESCLRISTLQNCHLCGTAPELNAGSWRRCNKAGVESYFGFRGQSRGCGANPTSPIVDKDLQRWTFARHSLHLPATIYRGMDTFHAEWYAHKKTQEARDRAKETKRKKWNK